jgi:WD40 repeat protein
VQTLVTLVLALSQMSVLALRKADAPAALPPGKQEVVIQAGHTDLIKAIEVSANGRIFVTGANDRTVKIWRQQDGLLLRTIQGFPGTVDALALNAEGTLLAVGGTASGEALKLFTTVDGALRNKITSPPGRDALTRLFSISLTPDGRLVAGASIEGSVVVWNADDGSIAYDVPPASAKAPSSVAEMTRNRVNVVAFSPDGQVLAYEHPHDTTVVLRRVSDFGVHQVLRGYQRCITKLHFTPDSAVLVGWSDPMMCPGDSSLHVWKVADGSVLATIPMDSKVRLRDFDVTPDGKSLIVSGNGRVQTYSVGAEGLLTLVDNKDKVGAEIVRVMSDGKRALTEGGIRRLGDFEVERKLGSKSGLMTDAVFTRSGRLVMSHAATGAGWGEGAITVWRAADGALERSMSFFAGQYASVSVSDDERFVATGCLQGCVAKLDSGELVHRLEADYSPNHVVLSPKGDLAVAIAAYYGATIFRMSDGKEVRKAECSSPVAFSPDGEYLACRGKCHDRMDSIAIRRVSDGQVAACLSSSTTPSTVTYSPDGRTIAVGHEFNPAEIFSADGTRLGSLQPPTWVLLAQRNGEVDVAFSPKGDMMASASLSGAVHLWKLPERTLTETLSAGGAPVTSVAFSPDGRLLAATSEDGAARVWDLSTKEWVAFLGTGDTWLQFTPDGYFDGSRQGGSLVAVVQGFDAWAIDQFAVHKNRPDILLSRLGWGTPELLGHFAAQHNKRLRKLGLKEDETYDPRHVPTARIVNTTQDGKLAFVSLSVADAAGGLASYNVYVNDVPIFGAYGKPASGNVYEKIERIELVKGDNRVEVSATNRLGLESYRASASFTYAVDEPHDLYFIGFGLSRNKDQAFEPLMYAGKDVTDLAAVFARMKGTAFRDVHIITYLDKQVTTSNIKKAKKLLAGAKPEDTYVLFIAGHGLHAQDANATYYYAVYDADPKRLDKTAADFDLIEDLLQGVAPRQKLFLMDTCESGEADETVVANASVTAAKKGFRMRGLVRNKGAATQAASAPALARSYLFEKDRYIYNDLLRRSGAVVFSSSTGSETSAESDAVENGFFTEQIMAALSGKADANKDGVISLDELRQFVPKAVAEMSGGTQHPTIDRDNLAARFGFPVVR